MRDDLLDERKTVSDWQETVALILLAVLICVGFLLAGWMGWPS